MEFVTYTRFWHKLGQYHAFEFTEKNRRQLWDFLDAHGLDSYTDNDDRYIIHDPTLPGLEYRLDGPMVILCSLDKPDVVKFISIEEFKAECREVDPFI